MAIRPWIAQPTGLADDDDQPALPKSALAVVRKSTT